MVARVDCRQPGNRPQTAFEEVAWMTRGVRESVPWPNSAAVPGASELAVFEPVFLLQGR